MLVKIGNEVPLPRAIKLAYEDLKKKLFRYNQHMYMYIVIMLVSDYCHISQLNCCDCKLHVVQ